MKNFKKIIPKGLLARSLLIIMIPLLSVQLVLLYIFFERHTETVLKLLAQDIVADAAVVTYLIEKGTPLDEVSNLASTYFRFTIQLIPDVNLLDHSLSRNRWPNSLLVERFEKDFLGDYNLKINTDFIKIDVKTTKGLLQIQCSRKRFFSRTTPLVMIFTGVSSLLMFLIASLFMRNQIRPIRRLAEVAIQFGKGNDSSLLTPKGAREIQEATRAFLNMRERIKRHLNERFEMLSAISHDLKTPLTRFKLQLACMEETQDLIELKKDVKEMQTMLQSFLVYSKSYAEEPSIDIYLSELLTEVRHLFAHTPLTIEIICNESFRLSLKRNLFKRCLCNIIDNASQFATTLTIRVLQEETCVSLFFDDDGPGIDETEKEQVLKPFYRLDKGRNLNHSHVGLGLSIVKDVVLSHGGLITLSRVRKQVPFGLRIHICLPCD